MSARRRRRPPRPGQITPIRRDRRHLRPQPRPVVNVAVRPAFQGRGFGVRLLKLAEDLAAASGLMGTRLYTNKLFTENLRLYAALGYLVEREEALNGGVAVHMSKARSEIRMVALGGLRASPIRPGSW
jgi:GNAT superfamily N-acetyltransferase